MKTQKFFLAALFLCIFFAAKAQNFRKNTYLDAIQLAKIHKGNDRIKFDSLLRNYNVSTEVWRNNPFLKDISDIRILVSATASNPDETFKTESFQNEIKLEKVIPAISQGVNFEASAINGLATFMAGRFKQEIFQTSINQFFKNVSDEKSQMISGLFPKTFTYVSKFHNDSNKTNAYYGLDLLLLQETAQIDLNAIPKNLALKSKQIFPQLKNEPLTTDLIKSGYYAYEFTKSGESLNNLFFELSKGDYEEDSDLKKMLEIGDILSKSMENKKGEENIWITPHQVNPIKMSSSYAPNEINFFYGLLYEQLKLHIPYLQSLGKNEITKNIHSLFQFITKVNSVQKHLDSKNFDIKTPEQAINYLDGINQTLVTFLKEIPENPLFYYPNFAKNLVEIPTKYLSLTKTFVNQDYEKLIPQLLVEFSDYIGGDKKQYRSLFLMSQLATLKTSAEMEVVLENYALPIGSSAIKRNSNFNISLNGYVGLTGGLETAFGSQQNQTKGNIGLAAPIGISTTFAKGNLTAFLSVLDLGAIVNQRLGNDNTSYNNIKFENFFAPGLGMYYNLKNFPVSAGIHYSRISNLRNIKFEDSSVTIEEKGRNVQRINLNIVFDLPFFNLFNKNAEK